MPTLITTEILEKLTRWHLVCSVKWIKEDLCVTCMDRFLLYARLVGTYYDMTRAPVCLSVRLSVCPSVHKAWNTKQTERLQLGPSNLVHLLLMTRGRTLLIFKVRGQRSRSHLHIVVKPCKHDTDWTIWARTVKLGTHTTWSRSHLHIVIKPWKHNTDWTIWARTVKLGTHTTYD